jgi:queuosine biosynthesis protein QueD
MTERPSIEKALLNTDGGSRGNPGESGIGFTLSVDDGRELVALCRGGAYIGVTTSNVAEYRALIWGLRNARALKVRGIDIYADSELLVKQLRGEYRVKSERMKPLFTEVRQLLEGFGSYSVQHVPREQNSAADALANEAMDARGSVGDFAVAYESGDLFGAFGVGAGVGAGAGAADAPATSPTPDETASPSASPDFSSTPDDSTTTTAVEAPVARNDDNRKGNPMTDMATIGIYTLTIREHFDAAHALVGYPGQCRNLHGHTWDVEVSVRGTELDEVGIVYDFNGLKANLREILGQYDHRYLNEIAPFDTVNATAENLARVIYEQMVELLPEGIELVEVAVWESPIAKLTYSR